VLSAFTIARKDLRQRVRDRSAIVLSILAPLGLAALLGAVLPSDEEAESHRYAVVDEDGGPAARAFVEDVLGGFDREPGTTIATVGSATGAERMAEEGDVAAAWIVPDRFSQAVGAGAPARIDVIGNADSAIATQIAEAVAGAYVAEVNAVRLSVATALEPGEGPDPAAFEELRMRASAAVSPIGVRQGAADSRELDASTFYAAGMAVFFLFFTAQYGVLSLLGERSEGTLARLRAAPIPPGAIVAGKALSTFVLGLVSMVVLVVAATLLLGADFGDPIGVAVLILGAVVSAMGLTSLVAGMARTEEQANGYGSILAVTLGILGGTFFPLSQAPGFLTAVSRLTPHHWLMRGFADLGAGGGVGDVLVPVAALVAFGLVTGGLALARARRTVMTS
jgi:linearmycin/streptolysin S transport system permease protein